MIAEDVLETALREAAAAYEVPADGPDRIRERAASGAPATAPGRHRRLVWAAAAVVVAAGSVAVAVVGGQGTDRADRQALESAPGPGAVADAGAPAGGGGAAPVGQGASAGLAPLARGGAAAGVGPAAPQPGPGVQPLVVRTGSIDLQLPRGALADVVTRLTALATGAGGMVSEARTAEAGRAATGTVTLRVPTAAFESVLTEVRRLGEVRSLSVSANDVTGQAVDLDARIRALDATRAQYLALLSRARAIGDILAVQERLNDAQTQIEQLQSQRAALADRAALATLVVSLAEEGATRPAPRSGFAKAWDEAVDGFTGALQAVLAASGTAVVVLAGIAVAMALARLAWARLRRLAL